MADDQRHRHVHEAAPPAHHGGLGAPGHGRVHRGVGQAQAVDAVVGVGGHASHGVARVDVAHRGRQARPDQVRRDGLPQQRTDVAQPGVAGGVGGVGEQTALLQQLLARSLGHYDDHEALLAHVPLDPGQQAVRPFERERHFGDEHDVGGVAGQRGVAGDETGMPAHQLHDADAVGTRRGLDGDRVDEVGRLRERALEAEGLVGVGQIVVDRLGDPDDRDVQTAPADRRGQVRRGAHPPVTTDDEQRVHPAQDQAVDHFLGLLPAARAAQDGAAGVVYLADPIRCQLLGVVAVRGRQPAEPVAEAEDPPHAVVHGEFLDDAPDDVVEPRAQPAAGHHARRDAGGVEVDLPAGSGRLEARQLLRREVVLGEHRNGVLEQHPVALRHVVRRSPLGREHFAER